MLSLALVACQVNLGGPEPPGPPIEVSSDAASDLRSLWASALSAATAGSGEVQLIINERQLTSFLTLELESGDESPLLKPQVYLRDGLVQIYGVAQRGPFLAHVLIGITPEIDESGELSFAITTAEFGPLPMPEEVRQSVASLISEAFAGSVGSYATGIRLKAVAIQGGEMAISGEFR